MQCMFEGLGLVEGKQDITLHLLIGRYLLKYFDNVRDITTAEGRLEIMLCLMFLGIIVLKIDCVLYRYIGNPQLKLITRIVSRQNIVQKDSVSM